ncbi:MAG TPA: ATP-binding protein [Bryobacteraceae bacterium]|nr:ATP-binding protein [Bryobacteraceae bacterium]HPT28317.1 ATP-binding protein [Bryobacteraceae bacterium]
MTQRYRFASGLAALLVLTTLVIWQGSFTVGDYGPRTTEQTYVYWGLSTLIFLLTVLLAFMMFRDVAKLYSARRAGREGSRIRTKILVGALTLTFLPTIFLVLWSVEVLNRNLDKWFSRPAENIRFNLAEISTSLEAETRLKGKALARWVAGSAELRAYLASGPTPADFFRSVCESGQVSEAHVLRPDGGQIAICEAPESERHARAGRELDERAEIPGGHGFVVVRTRMPVDLARSSREINLQIQDYDKLASGRKETRSFYLRLLLLITLFVLFIATWVALFLARQITSPVTALVDAARAVRGGDLSYRVTAAATDEFATLVRAFNEMIQNLQAGREELDKRRRFIETVLESIPSGVISLSHEGAIQLVNQALCQIFPADQIASARRLSDLIPPENEGEFSRLLKRARRTGAASRQVELTTAGLARQLSVTVSALDARINSGFVMVLEDTSELLRAQRAAAWHEVARRIAHELKNPLTPIALSAERIERQIGRCESAPPEVRRIIHDCCSIIGREVASVKGLVDEFGRFARFPSAQPVPTDLNEAVAEALAVFDGRLSGITVHRSLASALPQVALDKEQFKRVIVNLVDNAAEAMSESPLRQIVVATALAGPETVELTVADTGIGISTGDKEKLFLPSFSTKQRGTGLGLAIVSHILSEHNAQIRVEDNKPVGARFIIEFPAVASSPAAGNGLEVTA